MDPTSSSAVSHATRALGNLLLHVACHPNTSYVAFQCLYHLKLVQASGSFPSPHPCPLTASGLHLYAVPVRFWLIIGLCTGTELGLKCSLYKISCCALNLLSFHCFHLNRKAPCSLTSPTTANIYQDAVTVALP